jgi:uncharacterized protein involved in exopolysaccharide biosynthesis
VTEAPTPVLEYAPNPRQQRSRGAQFLVRWGMTLLVIVACATIAIFLQTPTYRAIGFLQQTPTQTNLDTTSLNLESQKIAAQLRSAPAENAVLQLMGRPVTAQTAADLRQSLAIIPITDSKLVEVMYTDPSGGVAIQTANAVMLQATRNSPANWGVAQIAWVNGGPERDWARAFHGALLGVLIVLGWRITRTMRDSRRRRVESAS